MDTPEARALAQARAHAQATLARYHSGDIDRKSPTPTGRARFRRGAAHPAQRDIAGEGEGK